MYIPEEARTRFRESISEFLEIHPTCDNALAQRALVGLYELLTKKASRPESNELRNSFQIIALLRHTPLYFVREGLVEHPHFRVRAAVKDLNKGNSRTDIEQLACIRGDTFPAFADLAGDQELQELMNLWKRAAASMEFFSAA